MKTQNAYLLLDTQNFKTCQKTLTENSVYYHSLRSHLQVMVWETLDEDTFDPLEWGWSAEDGLKPGKREKPVAPSELLNFIRCKYKSGYTSKMCS